MLTITDLQSKCSFSFGLVNIINLPTDSLAQVSFWGRSNVGKSSIINAITNKKSLARVSKTPGRTQEINFFITQNESKAFYIVDLPGYGFAKATRSSAYKWAKTTEKYIVKSLDLRKIYLLIDAKVGFKDIDFSVMEFLNYHGKLYQIVFTKCDKTNQAQMNTNIETFNTQVAKYAACFSSYIVTSTSKKIGIIDLQNDILTLANQ